MHIPFATGRLVATLALHAEAVGRTAFSTRKPTGLSLHRPSGILGFARIPTRDETATDRTASRSKAMVAMNVARMASLVIFLATGCDPDFDAQRTADRSVGAEEAADIDSLHDAARADRADRIWLLVNGGADVETRNEKNQTPLHVAAISNAATAIRELVKAGANTEAWNDKGPTKTRWWSQDKADFTALHYAAFHDAPDAILALAGGDANLEAKDKRLGTPLHVAAIAGSLNAIEALAEAGAYVNARNGSDATPLHMAAMLSQANAIRLLLKHGADVNAKQDLGFLLGACTPLDWAGGRSIFLDTDAERVLKQAGGVEGSC